MNCREITELVTDYLEGRLSLGQRLRFQLHLGSCRHCRAYLRQMRMTVRMAGRLADEPVPPAIEVELLQRFRSFRR
jgi:predicted anti-sigma-YlaC factor YlaD